MILTGAAVIVASCALGSPVANAATSPPALDGTQLLILEFAGSGKEIDRLVLGSPARLFVDDQSVMRVAIECSQACTERKLQVTMEAELPSAKGKKVELFNGALTEKGLESFPPTIDLQQLGLGDGARVDIHVTDQDSGILRRREAVAYVRNTGLDLKYSDTFLFVRSALSRSWSLAEGAQAAVGWHFDGTNGFERVWNALDPHVGLALALLDFQEDKTTEYGLGVAATFLSGTVVVGYGWNLSADVRSTQYAFFGFSIVKLGDLLKKK